MSATPCNAAVVLSCVFVLAAATACVGRHESDVLPATAAVVPHAPALAVQPLPMAVREGDPAMFRISLDADMTAEVQWLIDGVPVAGATEPTLQIHSTTRGQDGAAVRAEVRNAAGVTRSDAATLRVDSRGEVYPWE
jgi:hypothetical protein